MNSRSNLELRRCRPLLGTFVEITASGLPAEPLSRAVNAAFDAIETIHHQMSVHSTDSELSLLNRLAAQRPVKVSRELFDLLRRADGMAAESDGAFDYTIAPLLARWGLLPARLRRARAGNWRDVLFLPGREIRFLRPLAIDLGGIAKGFAVDRAIEVLTARKVASGLVNAGGDLRVFGREPSTIHLRHPSQPQAIAGTLNLRSTALATSSPCFTAQDFQGRRVSHLVDSLRQAAVTRAVSVSVRARECWLADALTKIVLNAPRRAAELLAKYDAEAYVLTT